MVVLLFAGVELIERGDVRQNVADQAEDLDGALCRRVGGNGICEIS